ncbi:MAG: siroheme synthase CysG [Steroidobacteraceae bacterium]|jgi:uroporphyrin-III C-methyltransferase/precorrin-2 dehydrogenase/sirohydrochlorin ferrochelatase|nr:siroheme synthase CysG [Steroidobacteraceae bacterium]
MRYFPLFLDLDGRDVLVIGGGSVALRKVETLRSAGARVRVIAETIHEALRALATRDGIPLQERRFESRDIEAHGLPRPRLVIAATSDREVNAVVARAADAAGIPCNVVDDRELSTCLMPAIIDRSPVQIAVSTGGASPVLARLIRERLEALLDESLGPLAQFAERWRVTARKVLANVSARRRYLSWLLTGSAAQAIRSGRSAEADRLATRELARLRHREDRADCDADSTAAGHVSLVGAGPGDPGLLTLKGLRALQEADVVIHDRLASAGVLELARRDAERIDVGKRPGAGTSQDAINALLVEHARRGRRVVRLKGGDPFIFGRGGEEIDALRAAGISFDVVPGITAAVAASASAAIPLTDRRHVHAVRLITGNDAEILDAFDFSDVAAGRETLAVYMGVAQLPALRARLLAAGVTPAMPVALIENASRAEQRVVATTAASLVAAADAHHVASPAIALVGSVAVNQTRST